MQRGLDPGIGQFTFGLPGSPPPHHQSLWLCSDGYFYAFQLREAEVSHRNFVTPTLVLRAAWSNFGAGR